MSETNSPEKMCLCKRLLARFGIQFPAGALFPITVTRRLLWLAAAGVCLFLLGTGGFVYVSSKPRFCGTCHVLRPYYESWKTSEHGKRGTGCMQCHVAPGFVNYAKRKLLGIAEVVSYVTQTYDTNLSAEIPDAACLREGCHDKRLLEGKVSYRQSSRDTGRPKSTTCLTIFEIRWMLCCIRPNRSTVSASDVDDDFIT